MKLKTLLLAICALWFDAATASNPTDYFQSTSSGNWSLIATWQSSTSSVGPWVASTLVPDNNSQGIFIRSGTTVTIDAATSAQALTIDAGGTLIHPSGVPLTIYDGTAAYDFVINGTYQINGTAPTYSGTAPKVWIASTAEVVAPGDVGGGSDDFARDTHVYWNSALFDWLTPLAFQTSGVTYFPNASATDKARFRIDANVGNVGSNSPTTINGKFEVGAGYSITWQNSGAKIFRDGLGGAGTIIQAATSGPFQITSASAVIDGTISISLISTIGNALEITAGASAAISGSPTLTFGTVGNSGATLFIGGKLIHDGSVPIDISNGSLTMNGQNVPNKATLSGTGTFTGSPTASVIVSKFATATLYFTPGGTSNYLKTLTVSTQGTVTLGNALNMAAGTDYGTVTVTANGVLNSDGFLTLKSDANGTARVAQGAINGLVIQERYIPAKKAWRFLHLGPFSSSPQSINAGLQEGNINGTLNCALNGGTPGYGTMLIYKGTNGYDFSSSQNPSIKMLMTNGTYAAPTSTTGVNILDYEGYMIFIYGDRQICLSDGLNIVATPTTLRTEGIINSGTITKTIAGLQAGDFVTIGNPFPSSVDLTNVLATASGISNSVWIWDPGSYGTYGFGTWVLASGNTIVPAGGTTNYPTAASARVIQSGQAFLVQATAATISMTFTETDKTTATSSAVFAGNIPAMNINVSSVAGTTAQLLDGVAIRLDSSEKSGALKLMNTTDYLYLQRGDHALSIEARKALPSQSDTFFLEMNRLSPQGYRLDFTQEYFAGKEVRLIDAFAGKDTIVSNPMEYKFTVTADTNSYQHRFMLVVRSVPEHIVTKDSVMKFYPNPVQDMLTISGLPPAGFASIIDAGGRVLKTITFVSNTAMVSCSFLKNGIYFLRVGEKMFKFIKL